MTRKTDPKRKLQVQFKLLTSILPKIRKFIEKRTVSGRTKHLSYEIRKFIGDECDVQEEKHNQLGPFLKNSLKYLFTWIYLTLRLNKIPLFNPENKLKLVINSLIVTYNLFYLFLISVEVFFEAKFGDTSHYFNLIATGAWISEMVIQMNTACYHHNHFVTDRSIIMKIYLKEYLFFEILPLLFEGRKSEHPGINILLHLPLLLKIKGMMIILEKLEFFVLQVLKKAYVLQLFKLCMKVILLGHLIACSWFIVAKLEYSFSKDEHNWINKMNEERTGSLEIDLHWYDYYLEALYWAFSEMMHNSTERPKTDIELAYASFTMLLSSILFVYLINSIGAILADIDKQQEDYKKDLNLLNNFMKRKKIDLNLRRLANLNLLKYYQQQSRDKILQEKEILKKLSGYMQRELLVQANQKFLKKIPLLQNTFSQDTLTKLYSIMEEEVYAPNQVIFSRNKSHFNDNLYLIIKGQVTLFIESLTGQYDSNKQIENQINSSINGAGDDEQPPSGNSKRKDIKILIEGDYFGTHSFVTGFDKTTSIMSTKFTELIKFEREKFMEIIRENKGDFEKFMDLKDKVIFDSNLRKAEGINCRVCQSSNHVFKNCNKIYFDKSNPFIYYKFNKSEDQKRSSLLGRKTYVRINAIIKQKLIHQKASYYQEINNLIDSSEDEEYIEESLQNEEGEDEEEILQEEQDLVGQDIQLKNIQCKDQNMKRLTNTFDFDETGIFENEIQKLLNKKMCKVVGADKRRDSLAFNNSISFSNQQVKKSISLTQHNDQPSCQEPSIGAHVDSNFPSEKIERENINDSEFAQHIPYSPMTPLKARNVKARLGYLNNNCI